MVRRSFQTLSLILVLLSSLASWAKTLAKPHPDWNYVEKKLKGAGFKKDFIGLLRENYDSESFTEVLELNTLLFLRKSDYHGVQVTPEAATTVRAFVSENGDALSTAEKEYGVTKEVVASLLWIESRHGKTLGQFHVASVFVDLVQADRPAVISYLHKAAKRFTHQVTAKNRKDITSRTGKRVKWAISELKAIQKMSRKNQSIVRDLRGSFAGAFGMAQFLPSSFVAYAKAYDSAKFPDLLLPQDAIQSVAYYLHENGWKKSKPKSHFQALMRYNNSEDYANAILKLADHATPADEKSKRAPANRKRKP